MVGGLRVVDRVHDALLPVTGEILLIANDPRAASWRPGTRVVGDLHAGTGGLAGVHAALAGGRDVLAVAWDMPFVTSALLAAIRERAELTGADVCVPESDSHHRIEPFCAFYRSTVLKPLDEFLAGGGGPARDFIARCTVARLPVAAVRMIGDPEVLFLSVNSAEDLERARSRERV